MEADRPQAAALSSCISFSMPFSHQERPPQVILNASSPAATPASQASLPASRRTETRVQDPQMKAYPLQSTALVREAGRAGQPLMFLLALPLSLLGTQVSLCNTVDTFVLLYSTFSCDSECLPQCRITV